MVHGREMCSTTGTDLWNILQGQCSNISHAALEKLQNRMSRIAQTVLGTRGGFFEEHYPYKLRKVGRGYQFN